MKEVTQAWTLRSERRTGDLAWLLAAHADLAREHGWDATFEAYVAQPISTSLLAAAPHERLWIAEREGHNAGSIAIVQADFAMDHAVEVRRIPGHPAPVILPVKLETAQLRWFLVQPEARGQGLGRLLLEEAIAFSREHGYQRVILWTVSRLEAATRLYHAAGFEKTQEIPAKRWGTEVIEEQYTLWLGAKRGAGP
jgi:GNAT superfamily N-acetyltransferase